jgi:hypothetical protein
MDQLRRASELAWLRTEFVPPESRGKKYTPFEYLGDTSSAEVRELLYYLFNINPYVNSIFATMETFAKAKSITVKVEAESVLGEQPVLNRIVIEAHS